MEVAKFKQLPLLGILRGIGPDLIEPLVEAIVSSGLKAIEIAMNTPQAPDLIQRAQAISRGRLMIGAGTVLTMEDLKSALDAGATFIVMPALVDKVLEYCVKNKIPAFPGALTPQEIFGAWRKGATMVKVFPVKFFGPEYIKEIKGPFNDIEILACGGITPQNLNLYFLNGASAVAFGASVFRKEWLAKKDFSKVSGCLKDFVREARVAREKKI